MKIIIDRFENNFAIIELETGGLETVPRALFPGAKEGDVFQITKDDTAQDSRSKRIGLLMQELWQDDATGQ